MRLTRKLFDEYLNFILTLKVGTPHPKPDTTITEDDISIIEYVGGYILQKLKKKSLSESQLFMLNNLTDEYATVAEDSLIHTMNNNNFGTLTVPKKEIVKLLIYVESNFRQFYNSSNIHDKIFSSIDFSYVQYLFPLSNVFIMDLLVKICHFYLKIRCYQKAKCINSNLKVKFDQNVSQRKALKN